MACDSCGQDKPTLEHEGRELCLSCYRMTRSGSARRGGPPFADMHDGAPRTGERPAGPGTPRPGADAPPQSPSPDVMEAGAFRCPMCLAHIAAGEAARAEDDVTCPRCRRSFHVADALPLGDEDAPRRGGLVLDIEPMTFDVTASPPFASSPGGDNQRFVGKGRLAVTSYGMEFETRRLIGEDENVFVPWDGLRDLRNDVLGKNRFTANFGEDESDLILTLNLGGGDALSLARVFDSLPRDACCPKCPECGGAVADGRCQRCNASAAAAHRIRGLRLIGLGVVLSGLGIAATSIGYHLTSPGGEYPIWIGLICGGAAFAIWGALKLVFGLRG